MHFPADEVRLRVVDRQYLPKEAPVTNSILAFLIWQINGFPVWMGILFAVLMTLHWCAWGVVTYFSEPTQPKWQ